MRSFLMKFCNGLKFCSLLLETFGTRVLLAYFALFTCMLILNVAAVLLLDAQ